MIIMETVKILRELKPSKGLKFVPMDYWNGATYAKLKRNIECFHEKECNMIFRRNSIGPIDGHGMFLLNMEEDFTIGFGKHFVSVKRKDIVTLAQREK